MIQNSLFFSNIHDAMPLQWASIDKLWRASDRCDVPDVQFVAGTRLMMADAGCKHLFKQWCDVIGYTDVIRYTDDDDYEDEHCSRGNRGRCMLL